MFLNKIVNEIGSVFILELLFSNSNRIKKVLPLWTNVATLLGGGREGEREGGREGGGESVCVRERKELLGKRKQ